LALEIHTFGSGLKRAANASSCKFWMQRGETKSLSRIEPSDERNWRGNASDALCSERISNLLRLENAWRTLLSVIIRQVSNDNNYEIY